MIFNTQKLKFVYSLGTRKTCSCAYKMSLYEVGHHHADHDLNKNPILPEQYKPVIHALIDITTVEILERDLVPFVSGERIVMNYTWVQLKHCS